MAESLHPNSGERLSGPELARQLEQLAERQVENFQHHPENQSAERAEAARARLEHLPEPAARQTETDHRPAHSPTRLDKLAAYRHTLKSVQRHLSPASRRFSNFIHAPIVEKTSEVMEKTVMRPSVTLGASLTALAVGGFFYLTASTYGFRLSGSEFILSLLIGAVLGGLTEALLRLFKRRE